ADKVIRGFAGMTTAFLEIPGNMVRESDARGPAVGIPLGFAKGCGMIVPRVLVGVWEFMTAPFALPDYQPILEPEYPWSYFEGRGRPRRGRPPAPGSPPPAVGWTGRVRRRAYGHAIRRGTRF